jgi:RimJ/RimL family protein N-acetyltransferase
MSVRGRERDMGDEVTIREGRVEDAAGLVAFMTEASMEPGLGIGLEPGEFAYTVEEEENWVREHVEGENSLILVAVTDEGEIVGLMDCMGGRRWGNRHEATLGIMLKKEWRGKGLGSELMRRAVDWARESGVVKRLQLEVFTTNEPAIHVYEKLGFEREGVRRKAFLKGGVWLDSIVMAVLF